MEFGRQCGDDRLIGGRFRRSAHNRGHSSAGRAVALQASGRRFDPDWLHHFVFRRMFALPCSAPVMSKREDNRFRRPTGQAMSILNIVKKRYAHVRRPHLGANDPEGDLPPPGGRVTARRRLWVCLIIFWSFYALFTCRVIVSDLTPPTQ